MPEELVIIGNGMAATRLRERLLTLAPERWRITVIGREAQASYNRIQLSPVLSGEKPFHAALLRTPDEDARQGVTLLLGKACWRLTSDCARSPPTVAACAGIIWCSPPAPSRRCPPFPASRSRTSAGFAPCGT